MSSGTTARHRSPRQNPYSPSSASGDGPGWLLSLLAVGAVLAITVGLGLGGRFADSGGFVGGKELARLGGPWLVGAFLAGLIAGWRRHRWGLIAAAAAGALAIAGGSVLYYLVARFVQHDTTTLHAAKMGIGWGAAGLVVGGALGFVGGLVSVAGGSERGRATRQGAAVGLLAGLLAGEAIALLQIWASPTYRVMAGLEAIGALLIVCAAAIGRPWRWVVAAAVAAGLAATVAPLLTVLVRETLQRVGWGGV